MTKSKAKDFQKVLSREENMSWEDNSVSVAHVEGSKNEAKYDFNGVLENERQEIDERKKESERKRENKKWKSLRNDGEKVN